MADIDIKALLRPTSIVLVVGVFFPAVNFGLPVIPVDKMFRPLGVKFVCVIFNIAIVLIALFAKVF